MSKSSFFKRSKTLLGMASKIAAKEARLKLSQTLKNAQQSDLATKLTRIQQATTLTKNLSQLKGAAMKAGQLLSIDASQFLPPEALEILSELQNKAQPEEYEVIHQVLQQELGEKLHLITDLNPQALAAASIGQVHQGQFKQKDIVLKVQYPDIEENIDSDLSLLRKITELILIPTSKEMNLKETFSELARVLKLEADYTHELKILKFVHSQLQSDPFFSAPYPYPELSTRKVLTMDFSPGITLNEWLNSSPPIKDRQLLGEKMLQLFLKEFLDWKVVQTDPNFGNFLVQTQPLRVTLLDFGSSLQYSPSFIEEYLNMLQITAHGDQEQCFQQAVKFDLLSPKETAEVKEIFYNMMKISMEPFLSSNQPFDFSDSHYEKRTQEITLQFTKALKYSPPPRKVIFLHRKLGGLFALLKKMKVKIDISLFWEELMKEHKKYQS